MAASILPVAAGAVAPTPQAPRLTPEDTFAALLGISLASPGLPVGTLPGEPKPDAAKPDPTNPDEPAADALIDAALAALGLATPAPPAPAQASATQAAPAEDDALPSTTRVMAPQMPGAPAVNPAKPEAVPTLPVAASGEEAPHSGHVLAEVHREPVRTSEGATAQPQASRATPDVEASPIASLTPHASSPVAELAPHPIAIDVPVRHPAFPEVVAERLAIVARADIQHAELRLEPPDMGPVQARITVEDGQATIHMVAAVPETRAALEAGIPLLAERLAEGGLSLAGASVSSGDPRAQDPRPELPARPAGDDPPVEQRSAAPLPRARRGLVDEVA